MIKYLKKNYLVIGVVISFFMLLCGIGMWSTWASKISYYPAKVPEYFYTMSNCGKISFYFGVVMFAAMTILVLFVHRKEFSQVIKKRTENK